jgi:hypothetical protein
MNKGKMTILTLLFVTCYLLFGFPLFAVDVGLVLDLNAEYSGTDGDTAFSYKGVAIPRVTGLIGNAGDFYISAGLNFKNDPDGNNPPSGPAELPLCLVPELLRTDLSWQTGNMGFTVGRMAYGDPLGYIASGLFDGARFSQYTNIGTFSIGAWYTGFLYKKRAHIAMTEKEYTANNTAIEYNKDFFNTYFATRRVLAAVDWEHEGLGNRAIARLSLLSQFDLSDEKLNSQYLAGKAIIPVETKVPNGAFNLNIGGCFELIEASDYTVSASPNEIRPAFAAEAAFAWSNLVHYISLNAKYASGASDTFSAFLPLTTNTQGQIFRPKLSAIAVLSMDYIARLRETFSIGLYPAYFMLNDSESVKGNRFLGGEIFAACYWSPAPEININLGGGAFLPSLGNVTPEGKTSWRVELNVVLSLF